MALTLSSKALSRWVWLRGQAWTDGCGAVGTVHRVNKDGLIVIFAGEHAAGMQRVTLAHSVPDLTDEVTAACLPLVVRAVWRDWSLHAIPSGLHPAWSVTTALDTFHGDTEAEAWIAALEAAP